MSRPLLTVRLVFDRSLNPGVDVEHAAVMRLQDILSARAPRWSGDVVAWDPNPNSRAAVAFDRKDGMADAVATRTRTTLGFNGGSVEFRGSTGEFVVVVSVNDRPTRPVGGRLLMPNEITLRVLRAKVEGGPPVAFAAGVFDELCTGSLPLWAAVHLDTEYTAKVMQTTPSIRAVGRDFSRFLPGLFAMNYFDERYLELAPQILAAPGVRRVEHGAFLDVADPLKWETEPERYSAALDTIGPAVFFDQADPDRATVAPTFAAHTP